MKKSILIYTIMIIIALSIITCLFNIYNLRKVGIKSAIHSAKSISEVVKSGLTAHMINNNMHQINTFLQSVSNIENIESLWVSRSNLVAQQFKTPPNMNTPRDAIDIKVLNTGKMFYKVDESFTKSILRITLPYNAVAQKGINCLRCHNVKYGQTLGAVSIVSDISILREVGTESIYAIIVLIVTIAILFLFISKSLINPYAKLYDNFQYNIHQASLGEFEKLDVQNGLSRQVKELTNQYNNFISTIKDTSIDIDKKLQSFIGQNTSNISKNPLNHSKEIINNLSDLFQFKKQVELDGTKEEIYNRLAKVFSNKFKLKNFSIIEIDIKKRKMHKVFENGKGFYCKKIMEEKFDLCKAINKKTDIMSIDFHNSCPYFENNQKFSYCFNINISQILYLVIQFVFDTKKELKELKDKIGFIKTYLMESAPSIEVKLLMDALKESVFKDSLTGLYNRKFLEEYTKKMVPQAKRDNKNIAILMLDVDYFKAVNDEYGHGIGDKVLKELGRILTKNVRESDIIIRYGGEEFMVLLVGILDEISALEVAQKICDAVRRNKIDTHTQNKLKKTISLGLSMFPKDSNSFKTVVKNADIALYKAKNGGRDKIVRFAKEEI